MLKSNTQIEPFFTGAGMNLSGSYSRSLPMKSVRGKVPGRVRTIRREIPPEEEENKRQLHQLHQPLMAGRRWARSARLTPVGARDEPQAAVALGGVLQRDPHAHHSAQRLRVQECGVLVRRH